MSQYAESRTDGASRPANGPGSQAYFAAEIVSNLRMLVEEATIYSPDPAPTRRALDALDAWKTNPRAQQQPISGVNFASKPIRDATVRFIDEQTADATDDLDPTRNAFEAANAFARICKNETVRNALGRELTEKLQDAVDNGRRYALNRKLGEQADLEPKYTLHGDTTVATQGGRFKRVIKGVGLLLLGTTDMRAAARVEATRVVHDVRSSVQRGTALVLHPVAAARAAIERMVPSPTRADGPRWRPVSTADLTVQATEDAMSQITTALENSTVHRGVAAVSRRTPGALRANEVVVVAGSGHIQATPAQTAPARPSTRNLHRPESCAALVRSEGAGLVTPPESASAAVRLFREAVERRNIRPDQLAEATLAVTALGGAPDLPAPIKQATPEAAQQYRLAVGLAAVDAAVSAAGIDLNPSEEAFMERIRVGQVVHGAQVSTEIAAAAKSNPALGR